MEPVAATEAKTSEAHAGDPANVYMLMFCVPVDTEIAYPTLENARKVWTCIR